MLTRAVRLLATLSLAGVVSLIGSAPISGGFGRASANPTVLNEEDHVQDQPEESARYYQLKRVPAGEYAIPVERYIEGRAHIKGMPEYSTALNASRPRPGEIATYADTTLSTWIPLGPGNIGGRTRSLLINPNNPAVMYAAGVAGGIWKSTDSGAEWQPLDDLLPNLAVSSMAMDPANPEVIYAGTGEGFSNSDAVRGAGIIKTTNGGATWTHLASTINPDFFFVNDLVISRNISQRVYAATSTGVWSSSDGGASWALSFAGAGGTRSCLDLAIRTDQATDYIFASFGNIAQAMVFRNTDASGAGVWTSVLSETGMGRTSLAIAPSDQNTIYALAMSILNGEYRLGLFAVFRSTDGGSTWSARVRNDDRTKLNTLLLSSVGSACGNSSNNQGWYDNVIAVDPADPDRVWAGGVNMYRSDDGGVNWGLASGLHSDQHAIVFHPLYNGRANRLMFVGNDGGIYRTENARGDATTTPCGGSGGSVTWTSLNNNYGVTQFYCGMPYPDGRTYFGGTQDNGTLRGTDDGGINKWQPLMGGDGGYVAVDPRDTNILYAETQNLAIRKSTDGGATFQQATNGINNSNFLFIVPFAMDPGDSRRLWTGGDIVWRTSNGAADWAQASAPLPSGRVSAVAIAPTDPNAVVIGTSTGSIHHTDIALKSDANTTWPAVQPRAGFVSWVTYDPTDANTVYATYSSFNRTTVPTDRHIYKSKDGGATWDAIDGSGDTGIPDIPVHCIIVDPSNTVRLYIGTDLGVFVSTDGGANWAKENTGFANTVTESLALTTSEGIPRLFAFTHGRGAFRVRLAAFVSKITAATVNGKKLVVTGENFDSGAVILVNGSEQSTRNDTSDPRTTLVAKRGGKNIAAGRTVTLRVRNSDGSITPEFGFIRP